MVPTIYIARDPVLEDVLDDASDKLTGLGWTVIRGPDIVPGVPLQLSPDQRRELLRDADIIVASSRSRPSSEDLDGSPNLRGPAFPTIGFIGMGRVGVVVAERPANWDPKEILVHDPCLSPENATRIMRGELPPYPRNPEIAEACRQRMGRLSG